MVKEKEKESAFIGRKENREKRRIGIMRKCQGGRKRE